MNGNNRREEGKFLDDCKCKEWDDGLEGGRIELEPSSFVKGVLNVLALYSILLTPLFCSLYNPVR